MVVHPMLLGLQPPSALPSRTAHRRLSAGGDGARRATRARAEAEEVEAVVEVAAADVLLEVERVVEADVEVAKDARAATGTPTRHQT
eukprot:11567477-Heterocapsa_arctica.AAC.1